MSLPVIGKVIGLWPARSKVTRQRSRRCVFGTETLEPRHLLAAQPLITEFVADNNSGLKDSDGDYSDWIELFNAGDVALDLAGWHLTDSADAPTKWTFPSVTLEQGEYLVGNVGGHTTLAAPPWRSRVTLHREAWLTTQRPALGYSE